jgi:hypothetical protein
VYIEKPAHLAGFSNFPLFPLYLISKNYTPNRLKSISFEMNELLEIPQFWLLTRGFLNPTSKDSPFPR